MPEHITTCYPTSLPPFTLKSAQAEELPFFADSPHSGVKYPTDFHFSVPLSILRSCEDTDVDVLWSSIVEAGGTLLCAEFPRSYLDLNRNVDDIDTSILTRRWHKEANPTEKSRAGVGLIMTLVLHMNKVYKLYNQLLEPDKIQNRIDRYYTPYHQALNEKASELYAQFGGLWHLNLHSMPTAHYENINSKGKSKQIADFVLGNRDGETSSEEFIHVVANALKDMGYSVALNDPYKGVTIIANLGNPAQNRHSLQVEAHRRLYMDEATRKRNKHFAQLQTDLAEVSRTIASYIKNKI